MIKDLHLSNFKSFKEEQIEFSNLTVLTGINGMGKSSCIQALLLLRQSFLQGKLTKSGGLFLDGEYTKPGNGKDILFSGAGDSEKIGIDVSFTDNNLTRFLFEYSRDSDLQKCNSIESSFELGVSNLFNQNFAYLNADRLSPDRDVFPSAQSYIEAGNLGIHGQFTAFYIARNQRKPIGIDSLKSRSAATDNLLDNVNAWLGEIVPGIRVTTQYYPEINSARLGYNYEVPGGLTDEFKAANVGYGITYVLPIVVQLLIARPGQTVIIENPESHLHPSGQSTIARLCTLAARNGVQVVLESHSDHVINGILVAINQHNLDNSEGISSNLVKIYYVEREAGQTKSVAKPVRIEIDGRIRNAPRGFFDQFAKDMKSIMGF
jgi:predicted ATPase